MSGRVMCTYFQWKNQVFNSCHCFNLKFTLNCVLARLFMITLAECKHKWDVDIDKFFPLKICMNIHEQHLLAHFPSSGWDAQSRFSVLWVSFFHSEKLSCYIDFGGVKRHSLWMAALLLQFDFTIPVAAITYSKNIKSSHWAGLQLNPFILADLVFASLKTVKLQH